MAAIHFMGLLHVNYPRSWTLASHDLVGNLAQHGSWFDKAFLWEKRQLYRQMALYYQCAGADDLSQTFYQLFKQQFIHVESE